MNRATQLPRERLNRLLAVLERRGGSETVRQLARVFAIYPSEVKAAESLGWVKIETRKPRVGRPSAVVRKRELSETLVAKLPLRRYQIEKSITLRQWLFAMRSVYAAAERGIPSMGFPPIVAAYQATFPKAKSRAGASASASRLMRHPNVRAARVWFYAQGDGDIPKDEPMPETAGEIWKRLQEHGSWRVCWR